MPESKNKYCTGPHNFHIYVLNSWSRNISSPSPFARGTRFTINTSVIVPCSCFGVLEAGTLPCGIEGVLNCLLSHYVTGALGLLSWCTGKSPRPETAHFPHRLVNLVCVLGRGVLWYIGGAEMDETNEGVLIGVYSMGSNNNPASLGRVFGPVRNGPRLEKEWGGKDQVFLWPEGFTKRLQELLPHT